MENKKYNQGRKSDTMKVSEAMNDLLKNYHLEDKFYAARLVDSWEKVMGKPIANRTSKIYVHDETLFVHLTSAPLRQELEMSKDRVLELLEKEMGRSVVKKVVFR
jgi:predicted nucleic acid-binding Zn ribbon protein